MAKQELFSVETSDFLFSVNGPLPVHGSFALHNFPGGREVVHPNPRIIKDIEVSTGSEDWPLLKVECLSSRYTGNQVTVTVNQDDNASFLPCLFESIDYQFQLTNLGNDNFEIWHEYSTIRNRSTYFPKHRSSSGTFNFGNNVGLTTFQVRQNGKPHLSITLTVFSIKIDFLTDRLLMINELSAVHNALVFEMFEPTKSLGSGTFRPSLGMEWLTTFRQLSDDLLLTIQRIEEKSHNQIRSTTEILAVHKLRRPTKSLVQKITKHGRDQVLSRQSVSLEIRKVEVSTAENRYLKFLMRRLSTIGKNWISHIQGSDSLALKRLKKNEIVVGEIALSLTKIQRRLKSDFWLAVGEELPALHNKTTFLFQDLFLRFEKLYKTINRGVKVHTAGERLIYTISMSELYQIWTYCKLAKVISCIVNGQEGDISLKVEADAFRAVLITGRRSKVKINEEISISAEWTFTQNRASTYFSPLVDQQPDMVFEIANKTELNILDAKYRISVLVKREGRYIPLNNAELISEDLAGNEVIFRPKDDDLNTMHRYKDAIQTFEGVPIGVSSRRPVRLGIILYPHKPTLNDQIYLTASLESVEQYLIGAIPLAPGTADIEWQHNYASTEDFLIDNPLTEQIGVFANVVSKMVKNAIET